MPVKLLLCTSSGFDFVPSIMQKSSNIYQRITFEIFSPSPHNCQLPAQMIPTFSLPEKITCSVHLDFLPKGFWFLYLLVRFAAAIAQFWKYNTKIQKSRLCFRCPKENIEN